MRATLLAIAVCTFVMVLLSVLPTNVCQRKTIRKRLLLHEMKTGICLISSQGSAASRRVRDMVAGGPWEMFQVHCNSSSSFIRQMKVSPSPTMSLLCSHFKCFQEGVLRRMNILVLEDDARFVPRFWYYLQEVLESSRYHSYGVIWLQHFLRCDRILNHSPLSLKNNLGWTMLAKSPSNESALRVLTGGPNVSGTAGYLVRLPAIDYVLRVGFPFFANGEVRTSESIPTAISFSLAAFCHSLHWCGNVTGNSVTSNLLHGPKP